MEKGLFDSRVRVRKQPIGLPEKRADLLVVRRVEGERLIGSAGPPKAEVVDVERRGRDDGAVDAESLVSETMILDMHVLMPEHAQGKLVVLHGFVVLEGVRLEESSSFTCSFRRERGREEIEL